MSPDGDLDLEPSEAFEIALSGRRVELLLHPPASGRPRPDPGAIIAALRGSPLRSIDSDHVARALAEHAETPPDARTDVRIPVGEVTVPAYDGAPCAIVVSIDRLAAYAVPVDPPPDPPLDPPVDPPADPAADTSIDSPPADTTASDETATPPPASAAAEAEPPTPTPAETGPLLVTADELRALLLAAGVSEGLLDDVIDGFGAGAPNPDARCMARGYHPVAGADARLEYHVDPNMRGTPLPIEHGTVDFHELAIQRFVPAGAPLVTRHLPIAGSPGLDVLGTVTEPPSVKNVDLARVAGANTVVEGDTVIAGIVGRPVINSRGAIEVLPVFEVAGNVDYAVGNIDFPGDVIVHGDMKSGFSIVAGGSVSVRGLVEGASITAAHDLSVMGAVGTHGTVFEVGGDLKARYLHTTQARVAGTLTVISEIVNCTISAEQVSTSSQGRIIGGLIVAHTDVDAGTLGSREGNVTEVRVTSQEPEAVIRARRTVHPGLVVLIGEAHKRIEDEIDGASFWNVGGTVVGLKPTADIAAAEAARAEPLAA